MKCFKSLLIVLLLIFSLSYIGCEGCQKKVKHFKSGTIGLKRRVTMYTCNGTPFRTWEGRFMVELHGNAASFIDNGKEVKVSGMFTIEEI